MVSYFAEYTDHSFYLLAASCLVVDFYLLRKSGPLLCVGIGSLLTGIFISLGLIEYYSVAFVMLVGFSCASGGLLWDYLKSQAEQDPPKATPPKARKITRTRARITKNHGRFATPAGSPTWSSWRVWITPVVSRLQRISR